MAAFDDGEVFSEVFKGEKYAVILIGAAYVGKTALLYRYILDDIPEGLTSTVGVEFTKRSVVHKDSSSKVQLHIWDTAGQERFKSVTKHHYRGADACLLVFDISNKDSFDELPNWLAELRENSGPDCIVFLIGNKVDLDAEAKRVVSKAEATRYAKQHKLIYRESSSFWPREQPKQVNQIQAGIGVIFDELVNGNIYSEAFRQHEGKAKDCSPAEGKPRNPGVKLDAEALYNVDPEATTDLGKYAKVGVDSSFQREPQQGVIAQEGNAVVPIIVRDTQWTWLRSICRCFYPRSHSPSIHSASVFPESFYLPPQSPMNYGKKTLVLDLDETLVHSSFQGIADPDFVIPVEVNGVMYSVFVTKRPGVNEFLEQSAINFELVVFTASMSSYANAVIDLIDPDHHISHRLFREHCIQQPDGYVKDLSRLGRDLQHLILIDVSNRQNSSVSASLNPDNAILIKSFYQGKDEEFEQLYPLLQELIDAEDVRQVLRPQKRSISQTVTVDLEEVRSECNSPRIKGQVY